MFEWLKNIFKYLFGNSNTVNCCDCLYWSTVSGYPCDECNGIGSHFECKENIYDGD